MTEQGRVATWGAPAHCAQGAQGAYSCLFAPAQGASMYSCSLPLYPCTGGLYVYCLAALYLSAPCKGCFLCIAAFCLSALVPHVEGALVASLPKCSPTEVTLFDSVPSMCSNRACFLSCVPGVLQSKLCSSTGFCWCAPAQCAAPIEGAQLVDQLPLVHSVLPRLSAACPALVCPSTGCRS